MKPQPLRRYRTPDYPTKLQVLARRELLENYWPQAWRKNAEMAGMAALLLAANGCQEASDGVSAVGPDVSTVISEQTSAPLEGPSDFVAPIFHHGDGRGATGCIAVSPPVFLSEEEALQIIVEELGRAGINISQTHVTMEKLSVEQEFKRSEITIPEDSEYRERWEARLRTRGPDSPGVVKPLEVDGLSKDGTVVFEFVSRSDYRNFGGVDMGGIGVIYDMPPVAQALAERVAETGEAVYFGTFYDPIIPVNPFVSMEEMGEVDPGSLSRQTREEAEQLSGQMLRAQVTDFVNWLKAQGAI